MTERYALGDRQRTVDDALERVHATSVARRIWAREPALWKEDAAHREIIGRSLGWLTVLDVMRARIDALEQFSDDVRGRGFEAVTLLGMGGSSLCPEVCAATFGPRAGYPELAALDTTHPDTVAAALRARPPERSFFLVSSKSGGTIESVSLEKYFHALVASRRTDDAGRSFAAITDAGTSLERLAAARGYARTFTNPSDIGGRYSALSYFGLVPMALVGIDVAGVLDRATSMARRCGPDVPVRDNPGVVLGTTLGALARAGRDKVTFVLAPEIADLGVWLEQLLAESTGKEGVGIVPVDGEPLAGPGVYGDDRVFVAVWLAGSRAPFPARPLDALASAGHPVLAWELADRRDLGGEFFRWEFATAVAGAVLGIYPFDQPNVQESKDNTGRLVEGFRRTGQLEEGEPLIVDGALRVHAPGAALPGRAGAPAASRVAAWLLGARPGDYVAWLAYLPPSRAVVELLGRMRTALRDRTRAATTVGFGPRYLHSTGQLHKGGPDRGIFLQLTAPPGTDMEIPGEPYTLGTLMRAQALGDVQSLCAHGRRVLRVDLGPEPEAGLAALAAALESPAAP